MTVHNYSNTASRATLDAPLNSSAGTFAVSSFTGYPSVPFFVLMDRDTSSSELMEVTNVAGSTLTVTRGVGGTAATSHSAGAYVEHVIPAAVPQAVEQHIDATANVHGVTGALLGATDAGTLTNKTFQGAFVHNYSSSTPASPEAGYVVNADNGTARDGFVADGDGANTDRRGFLLSQDGAERVEVFYDGTIKVTPSGAASRPGIESTTSMRTQDMDVQDDLTVGGDLIVAGTTSTAGFSTGNLSTSGTLSVGGATSVNTLTAAGTITASGSGTGLSVSNSASIGTLTVATGNLTLSGSNARIGFPANPTVGSPGTATGQARYNSRRLEVWDGSAWYAPAGMDGVTLYDGHTTGTISAAQTVLKSSVADGPASGMPYQLIPYAQVEINNVTGGSRFDLYCILDDPTSGDIVSVGLGNGFTQTGLGISERLTGDHTVYYVLRKVVGSGQCEITAFNAMFTNILVPTSRTS